jgi:hypothetical protein
VSYAPPVSAVREYSVEEQDHRLVLRRRWSARLLGLMPALAFAGLLLAGKGPGEPTLLVLWTTMSIFFLSLALRRGGVGSHVIELDRQADTLRIQGMGMGHLSEVSRVECREYIRPRLSPRGHSTFKRELVLSPLGKRGQVEGLGRMECLRIGHLIARFSNVPWYAPDEMFESAYSDFGKWLGAQAMVIVPLAGWGLPLALADRGQAGWWPALAVFLLFFGVCVDARRSLLLDLEEGEPPRSSRDVPAPSGSGR